MPRSKCNPESGHSAPVTAVAQCKRALRHWRGIAMAALAWLAVDAAQAASLDIEIDARKPASGELAISLEFRDLSTPVYFHTVGRPPEYDFSNVRITDGEGREIRARERDHTWLLLDKPPARILVRYTVRPGGLGRHGHQGNVDARFAGFDGRGMILPLQPVSRARMRFHLPAAWSAALPFPREGDWYVVPDRGVLNKDLRKSCVVLGPMTAESRRIGTTDVSVHSYAMWDAKYRRLITDKTFRMYEYFHRTYGFNAGPAYVFAWTPNAVDNGRVMSGVWSNGMCVEMPDEKPRNWELVAHRIAHAVNRDPPAGLITVGRDDRWFDEAWATYQEFEAPAGAGITGAEPDWNRLYARYLAKRRQFPQNDLPIADEGGASASAVEYLHYTKAPAILMMLDAHIRKHSGKDIRGFMQSVWPRYRGGVAPFPFRRELEQYTGLSLDTFWNIQVHGRGAVVPVWKGTESLFYDKINEQDIAGTIAGQPLRPHDFFILANSDDYKSMGDVVTQWRKDVNRHLFMRRSGTLPYDITLADALPRMPAPIRRCVHELEALNKPDSGGPLPSFEPASNAAGRTIAALLTQEKQDPETGSAPVRFVRRNDDVPGAVATAFSPLEKISVILDVHRVGGAHAVEVTGPDGSVTERRTVGVKADGDYQRIDLEASRPVNGLYRVRIIRRGKPAIDRVFWQHPRV